VTEEQRSAVRIALSGQDAEPVTLTTDEGGAGVTDTVDAVAQPAPHDHGDGFVLPPEAIVAELQATDPMLFELVCSRALIRVLQAQLAALQDV
jgi:hypothetical protein